MQKKLPYYMAFPMPSLFGDDRSEKRDLEYLKSLYPSTVKMILIYVEEECERMEYEGSLMYDEYPDQLQLHLMCGRIYDKVKHLSSDDVEVMEAEMEVQDRRGYRDRDDYGRNDYDRDDYGRRGYDRRPQEDPVRNIVQILLFQEMMRRRCDYRKCRSRYY